MDFPLKFDCCPVCGSQSRVIEMEAKGEIEKGNLSEEVKIPVLITQTKIFDPSDKKLLLAKRQIPVIMGFFDVCANCGTLYAVELQKGIGVIEPHITKGTLPGQNTPPFFGSG